MSAAVRTFLVLLFTLPVVAYLGMQLGNEEFVVPIAACVLLTALAFNRLFLSHLRYEAFVLAVLIFGYIVGNRGFAQISPAGNFPLYLGEIGMVACLFSAAVQIAFKRSDLIPDHPLGMPIFLFLLYGGIRLVFDVKTYRLDAVRDSAMVYYALFFYIAFNVGQHERSRRFLEKALLVSLGVLVPTLLATQYFPDFFERFAIRGVPVILHKGDLAGIFLAVGMFYFYLLSEQTRWKWACRLLAMACFAMMILSAIRAAYVAALVGMLMVVLARRPGLLVFQAATAVVGLLALGSLAAIGDSGAHDTLLLLSDKLRSIVDVSGTGSYQLQDISASNNQFRLVWWQTVCNETIEKSPWVGLGFGYDLAERFLRTYWGGIGGDPTIRSPHCYLVTVFGRLGVVGVLLVGVIAWRILRGAYSSARTFGRGETGAWHFSHWLAVVALFVASNFGVILEGPMGGVVFWSILGLACSYETKGADVPVPELAEPVHHPREQELAPNFVRPPR